MNVRFGLENVRCFSQSENVRIAPLTILVGENSTGKSSFLALFHIANQIIGGDLDPNFGAEPFRLGAYEQIAHRPSRNDDPSGTFRLSLTTDIPVPLPPVQGTTDGETMAEACFHFTFSEKEAQPMLSLYEFRCYDCRLTIKQDNGPSQGAPAYQSKLQFHLETPSWSGALPDETVMVLSSYFAKKSSLSSNSQFLAYALQRGGRLEAVNGSHMPKEEADAMALLLSRSFKRFDFRTHPFGPIRLKPSRTYDFANATPHAEGFHTPSKLKALSLANRDDWQKIQDEVDEFGQESGLFENLRVKPLGQSAGDPFQIYIDNDAVSSNLVDAGYGVSQILPIVVDLVDNQVGNAMYLLQHPEVHLHPRAQAQLGDFLCKVALKPGRNVMVETHSDYLVDRVRMRIRERKIAPETVSLLFFERTGGNVRIRELPIDAAGDFMEAPQAYRAFFMEEQMRQLGL